MAAVLALLVLSVLPHHHHGALPCIEIKSCDLDDDCCGGHNHHSEKENENGQSCMIKDGFTISMTSQSKYRADSSGDICNNHAFYVPLYFIVADLLNFRQDDISRHRDPGDLPIHYKSADVSPLRGLRAPPVVC